MGRASTRARELEQPRIPGPNGYDDVLQAGRAIEKTATGSPRVSLAKLDEAALGELVEGNREAIARAREGLDRPFQVPVVYDVNHMFQVLWKDVSSIRNGLVRGLIAEGRLADIQGRVNDAVRSYGDLVRLGDAMSHNVPLFTYQLSVVDQTMGLGRLRDLRAKLSPDQCRRLIGFLEEIDRNRERASDVTLRESQFMTFNNNKMGFLGRISIKVSGSQGGRLARIASGLESSENRQNAARRVLLTDLALRVYRQQHRDDPPDLGALVPSILKSVPIDPYSEKPLLYLKHGNTGEAYSVGPDRDDDKLMPKLPGRHQDDRPWRLQRRFVLSAAANSAFVVAVRRLARYAKAARPGWRLPRRPARYARFHKTAAAYLSDAMSASGTKSTTKCWSI